MRNRTILFILCLFCLRTQAQDDQAVQTKADTWRQLVLQEKLFVHTDKSFYLAGEVLWCRLYCVDGYTHRPQGVSKLAYVEILDADNRPVIQGKIRLDDGFGEGSFALPPSVNSGTYRLRAYTNWMKNFGPGTFFEQTITIVNTIHGIDTAALTRPDTVKRYPIGFFPEGGDLVAGLPSFVAFAMMDDEGRAIDAGGAILSGNNDTVTTFHARQAGLGVFQLTPEPGQTYTAILNCTDGITRTWPLPPVLPKGYTMHLQDNGPDLTLTIHATPGLSAHATPDLASVAPSTTPGLTALSAPTTPASQNIRLFLHSSTTSSFFDQKPVIGGDSAIFTIPRSRLQDGNNRLTVFDAFGHPLAERQFFISPRQILHFSATTDQAVYSIRQKVRLDIALTDTTAAVPAPGLTHPDTPPAAVPAPGLTHPDTPPAAVPAPGLTHPDTTRAHLSIAVYRLDSLQGYPATDILRYLWAGSEWTGPTPSATAFDDPQLADLYSLTHGWSRFRWTDVLSHPYGPRLYPPEIRGQIITGRLSETQTGAPAKNIIAYLSAPGTAFRFAAAGTDTGGRFQFDLKDYYGQDGIVINTGSPYKITTFSPFSEQYTDSRLPALHLTRDQLPLLGRYHVGIQVQNIFSGDSLRRFSLPNADTLPFFGRIGYTYLLDNYVRFTTMEEVLREYVREINVTRSNGHLHLAMLDEPARSVFSDGNTLVLLDGVPVPDDRIFNYDPLKVRMLRVVPQEYILGAAHFSGIASFTTYKGDFEGLALDSNSLQIDYEGLQYHRQFYSPAYPTARLAQSRLPDFRNVLYWNPDYRVGRASAPVEFYTSDLPGEYLIVIQGLSSDGRAGVTYHRFTVQPAAYHPIP